MNQKTFSRTPPFDLTVVMQADRYRLRRAWERLQGEEQEQADSPAHSRWLEQARESATRREARLASIPELKYDPDLPITAHRQELIDLIQSRQTIVVCGETGSGKSTQLPKILLEAGLGARGMIGHTQPRRLAARAVASRLAEELQTRVGQKVGFKIRFTDATQSGTLVKLMTDGVLLAETQNDRFLDQYEALIIDEAHERSLNIDFLLGYLASIRSKRPDLKIIITSATIDPERFAEHFADDLGPAPIVEVSGRTYPVEIRYHDPSGGNDEGPLDEELILSGIASGVDELLAEGSGDTLVFLPTERDIRLAAKYLRGHFTQRGLGNSIEIVPLYARLSQAEQNKIFEKHSKRRIVLSTNVAESSLTVPGIHYVIDTGLVRISRYAPRSKVRRLPIEAVSQASANQRSGRCGRLGPGICIRLFSREDFEQRPRYTTPEIRRSDLASVLLQSLMLRLGPLEEFPLLDPPAAESLRDAQRTLRELGAIDAEGRLTAIGKQLGALPCEPRVGRMLLEGHQRQCLAEILVIAAGLECQDVRQRPAGQRPEADAAHAKFTDPHSDFLSLIRLWDFFEGLKSELGRSRLQRALMQNFLSYQGFREWADTYRQLREILEEAGLKVGKRRVQLPPVPPPEKDETPAQRAGKGKPPKPVQLDRPNGYAEIHQSLLAGLLSGIAERGDRHEYKGAGGIGLSLWPGSGLFRRAPRWIVAAEIVETTKRYARTSAEVDVEWIEQAGEGLLKHTYSDPHWSSKTGAAMVYRRSTLYGLTVASGKRVAYASIDPEAARNMLIEHGLVAGEWRCDAEFYRHNQELIADMHELAQRTRSVHYIVDRFHLANFYQARLPERVVDLHSLRQWLQTADAKTEQKRLWMEPQDLLQSDKDLHQFDVAFPNSLRFGETELPLEYRFEPGHAADGVTLTVPQAALRQLSDEALGWLVPGLLEEKILAIIKALPKSQRTSFVPAPDVAKKLVKRLEREPRDRPFSSALTQAMSEHAGERVTLDLASMEKLPDHLKFLVQVVDDQGHLLERGRDIQRLIAAHAAQPNDLGKSSGGGDDVAWENQAVTPNDYTGVPAPVRVRRGGVMVAAFPALVDTGQAVELRLVDTQAESLALTRQGLVRLFAIKHHRSLRSHVANLPGWSQASMQLNYAVGSKELAERLQDLLARLAFVEDQPSTPDRAEFEARNATASRQLSIAAQEVAVWLPKFASQAHELRKVLESAPRPWLDVTRDVRQQVAHLLQPGFLSEVRWKWLVEYPRYLQAARLRFEKLKNGGVAKDRKLDEPVRQAWQAYEELRDGPQRASAPQQWLEELENYRWMIEEFRVSTFAQQLGTKQAVSPKRMNEQLDKLRS
jgi:ATP-dependent helicase HrpA